MLKRVFLTVDECGRPDSYSFPVEIPDDIEGFDSSLIKHFISEEYPELLFIKDIEGHTHFFNINNVIHGAIIDDDEVTESESSED